MFARVITMQLKSDKLDEAAKNYKEVGQDAKAQKRGFNSNYLLIDRDTGKAVSVAFWDGKQDIIDDEESGRQKDRLEGFKVFLAEPFTREIYEVAAQS